MLALTERGQRPILCRVMAEYEVITMRRLHPLWRGFWLACAMAAGLVLLGATDSLGPFRFDRRMIAFAGAITVGAFIGALPARLRKGARSAQSTTWKRALRAFFCGLFMALSFGLAGDGRILPALMTGSAGAYGFCLAALATGFITVRIMGRKAT